MFVLKWGTRPVSLKQSVGHGAKKKKPLQSFAEGTGLAGTEGLDSKFEKKSWKNNR